MYLRYTLKTGTPVEDLEPILKSLRGVSRPEIQLGLGIHSVFRANLDISLHLNFIA